MGANSNEKFVHWWVQHSVGERSERKLVEKLTTQAAMVRRRAGTDIHTAAWEGDVSLVKEFLAFNAELSNAPDNTEFGCAYRPLHYASYRGHLDICRELLMSGAKIRATGNNGVTALFLAAQQGQVEVVRYLLD
ncbi:unnamed protein product, partial [Choristocarpus tenellus]